MEEKHLWQPCSPLKRRDHAPRHKDTFYDKRGRERERECGKKGGRVMRMASGRRKEGERKSPFD